jgi:hypothetical protein
VRQLLKLVEGVVCLLLVVKVAFDWLERRAQRKKDGGKKN